ncbi:MAG: hypothetical protein C0482_08955 [Gordonia sp.]|uniref:DUF3533 domain-containing protein n=1 Tax=Gordonia rubripertincta TaxID=36822 RepID=A0ABT4MQ67_GORRU|nr:hypothetical protein [Gordonia rubripertincta]MBA4022481.1 hypothetical protein [Gordonia sp. (in: high G+C Gram-positive bacteria)]MCZ4549118.1 hypothetical protein [Gordonia rubripertincta]
MNSATRIASAAVVVVGLLVAGLYVVGRLNPVPAPVIAGDVLGPDNGEEVSAYLARAEASLNGSGDARWALVSLVVPMQTVDVWSLTQNTSMPLNTSTPRNASTSLSQSIFNVPIDRVQTPTVAVPSGNTESSFIASSQVAAESVLARSTGTERARTVGEVAAGRLRAGCACVVGVVVRAPLDRLRTLAEMSQVRAVQALPADASAGLFSVVPLLPAMTTVVAPTPDDGPIPAA